MAALFNSLRCDGCGLAASAEHIVQRLQRLEWATRFRPIHIQTLFIGLAPALLLEDDFYRPPEAEEFFETFLDTLAIPRSGEQTASEPNRHESRVARLAEFQRRGYYLAWLCECPIESAIRGAVPQAAADASDCLRRLGPTLVKRIQWNYRPKQLVLLTNELDPARELFAQAGIGGLLVLDRGQPLHLPASADPAGSSRFRAALQRITSSAATSPV